MSHGSDGRVGETPPVADDLIDGVVRRLFGVRLLLHYAAALTDDRGQSSLQRALDELNAIIQDIRPSVLSGAQSRFLDR